ncbi:hypothetical protein PIB30_066297, partial [Stylosanthes scabra]|nr:hypothetical protein [Stylosanthes scabra]
MPKSVVKKIVSLQINFFWGKEDGSTNMANVKLEIIQKPREMSGLGVGDLELRNMAYSSNGGGDMSKKSAHCGKRL